MIPEFGHFLLVLALVFSVLLAVVPLWGVKAHSSALMRSAESFSYIVSVLVILAFSMLAYGFLTNDFSLMVVAQHSNINLPTMYKFTAIWGGHEGSLLLWVLILVLWMGAVALFSSEIPLDMRARILSVMGVVVIGFLLFMLMTSSPFERTFPNVPADGKDLNPLLQDFGMAIHPPMLYFGYVGFSVAFAFAIAALLSGEFDAAWVRWTRPWTTAAWGFLTIGIALGSWWAYYELGWGGWWFWDPVENASFMPWLVGTALMHSLAVTEQRGMFKSWTILLAIFTFSLSLLGTFLVRSGVLTSVHSFAADPERGVFILVFLFLVVGGSLILFALRAPEVKSTGRFSLLSREMFLLVNNLILVVAAFAVLVGTLRPIIEAYFDLQKSSVGAPYFNKLFVPLMLALIVFLAVGVLLRWKKTRPERILAILKFMLPVAAVLTAVMYALYQAEFSWVAMAGFLSASWLLASVIYDFYEKLRYADGIGAGLKRLSLSYYGMQMAHIGLIVTALGIAVVSAYGDERDLSLRAGDTYDVEGYSYTYHGVEQSRGPNYIAKTGHFTVTDGQGWKSELYPEKRHYLSQMGNVMTEAAIDVSLARDLFIALGEELDDGAWAVRIQYKPFIRLIWLGCIFMAIGALLAIMDKRYRKVYG